MAPRTRNALIATLGMTLLAISCWMFLFAPKGLLARNELRAEMMAKRTEIEELKQGNRALREQIVLLTSDTDTIESIARNELNLAMPGETVYRTWREEGPPRYVLNPGSVTAARP